MLKQYIDRDSSSVTPISVISSVPQEQSEMNSEDMNLIKSDPASSKLKNSDILKDLDQKLSHLDPVQWKGLKQLIHEYEYLFPDIPTRTDTFIMMWMLRTHNLSNNIHIELTQQNKNILRWKFSICWTMISLKPAKVNGVHLAFLCQTIMEYIGCAPITGRSIIWV